MKKILSLAVLAVLATITFLVPREIHRSKQAYEERMVAIVTAIKSRIASNRTATPVSVGIYKPMITPLDHMQRFSVAGVVSLQVPGGQEHAERFTAEIQNKCKDKIDFSCFEVGSLTVKGTVFLTSNELATVFGDLPFQIAKPEPSPATAAAVGAPAKEPIIGKPSKTNVESQQAPQEKGGAESSRVEAKSNTPPPSASKAKTITKPREEASARPGANAETAREPEKVPAPSPVNADTTSVREPSPAASAAGDSPSPPTTNSKPENLPEPPRATEQASTQEPNSNTGHGAVTTEFASRLGDTRPKRSPPLKVGDSSERVIQIQHALKRLGYDTGPADNVVGQKTRIAILAYQRQNGMEATGRPSLVLLKHMLARTSNGDIGSDGRSKTETTALSGNAQTATASLSPTGASDRTAQVQSALQRFGYDVGGIDNIVGRKTRAAIIAYQRHNGLEPTGEPSEELLNHIRGITGQPVAP